MSTLTERISAEMDAQTRAEREADVRTLTARIAHTTRLIQTLNQTRTDLVIDRAAVIKELAYVPVDVIA